MPTAIRIRLEEPDGFFKIFCNIVFGICMISCILSSIVVFVCIFTGKVHRQSFYEHVDLTRKDFIIIVTGHTENLDRIEAVRSYYNSTLKQDADNLYTARIESTSLRRGALYAKLDYISLRHQSTIFIVSEILAPTIDRIDWLLNVYTKPDSCELLDSLNCIVKCRILFLLEDDERIPNLTMPNVKYDILDFTLDYMIDIAVFSNVYQQITSTDFLVYKKMDDFCMK